jgi:hypothetical protein
MLSLLATLQAVSKANDGYLALYIGIAGATGMQEHKYIETSSTAVDAPKVPEVALTSLQQDPKVAA